MAQLITLTQVGVFDRNGSRIVTSSKSIKIDPTNISNMDDDALGTAVMFDQQVMHDGSPITGVIATQTQAQIQTLVDTVSSTIAANDGTVSAPSISFSNDTGSGLYRIGSNDIGFAVNGTKVAEYTATAISTFGARIYGGTPQTLTGAGAVNLTTFTTLLVTTGANALTLAAGTEGQRKFIRMKTDGGDGTLTVTNLQGGSTLTFNDAGDFVELFYVDAKWHIIVNSGATLA